MFITKVATHWSRFRANFAFLRRFLLLLELLLCRLVVLSVFLLLLLLLLLPFLQLADFHNEAAEHRDAERPESVEFDAVAPLVAKCQTLLFLTLDVRQGAAE
jgi:hypothetical protein